MAFGGVDTGIMNPMLAPRVAPRAGSSGEMPAARATAMAIGMTILAAAVLEAVSDRRIAAAVNATVRPTVPRPGNCVVTHWPSHGESPVDSASLPIARPPPNSRMTPRSIPEACSQVNVKRRDRSALPMPARERAERSDQARGCSACDGAARPSRAMVQVINALFEIGSAGL